MRKHIIGIYRIENTKNGKVYIGQSVDILDRISHHKRSLRRNAHINQHLQNAWNKDGEDAFSFDILEQCEESQLTARESYYIELYGGYNSDKDYNKRDASSKGSLSEETKQKIGTANRGKTHSDEWNHKCSESHKGRSTWNKGLTKEDPRIQRYVAARKLKGYANYMIGRIWINNGDVEKIIYPKDEQDFIKLGFVRGRLNGKFNKFGK